MKTPHTIPSLAWAVLAVPSMTVAVFAQSRDAIAEILERRVEDFSVQGQEARAVLEGLGSAYRFPVVIDPDVQGTVSFEVHDATLGTVIEAICQPKGWSFEVSGGGYLFVRRFVTRIYPVDYLQMTQTGSSSASINLSESAGAAATGFTGATDCRRRVCVRRGFRARPAGRSRRRERRDVDPERLAAERRRFLGEARGRPQGHGRGG
jgi:hypothetical protein